MLLATRIAVCNDYPLSWQLDCRMLLHLFAGSLGRPRRLVYTASKVYSHELDIIERDP